MPRGKGSRDINEKVKDPTPVETCSGYLRQARRGFQSAFPLKEKSRHRNYLAVKA